MSGNNGQILDAHTVAEIEHWLGKYPPEQRQSAVLAALRAAQHQNHGYLTVEVMDAVAEYLGMPRIAVYEVATFYSMFETKPAGRHSISVCTNISCMLNGADDLVAYIEGKLGIKTGESTSDGRIHLKREEECLAACCGGPMLMVDHVYHENLTKAKIDRILEQLD
ncbi:MAG: NADH-quinone oxidoreductase subunit E [Gammaproteobacteria bacterium]|nr:MAG: NADH-quinone oxidoreductase subunit E [Gammaproteobacteria bacterium]